MMDASGLFNQSSRHLDFYIHRELLGKWLQPLALKKWKKERENCNISGIKLIFLCVWLSIKVKSFQGRKRNAFSCLLLFPISHMYFNKCLTFYHKMFKWQLLWLQCTIWSKALEDNSLFCKGHVPYILVNVFKGLPTKYTIFLLIINYLTAFKLNISQEIYREYFKRTLKTYLIVFKEYFS